MDSRDEKIEKDRFFQFKFGLKVVQSAFNHENYTEKGLKKSEFAPCGQLGAFLWEELEKETGSEADFKLLSNDRQVYPPHFHL